MYVVVCVYVYMCIYVAKLGRDLFQLARRCVHDYGVNTVLFCPVLPRGPGSFRSKKLDFFAKAELFNASLKR